MPSLRVMASIISVPYFTFPDVADWSSEEINLEICEQFRRFFYFLLPSY